jgi:hypothetical protein
MEPSVAKHSHMASLGEPQCSGPITGQPAAAGAGQTVFGREGIHLAVLVAADDFARAVSDPEIASAVQPPWSAAPRSFGKPWSGRQHPHLRPVETKQSSAFLLRQPDPPPPIQHQGPHRARDGAGERAKPTRWNRTPSKRTTPPCVATHKYPSAVWARPTTRLSGRPSSASQVRAK